MSHSGPIPEHTARQTIEADLRTAGCPIQDLEQRNLHAGRGVAVRDFTLDPGRYDDYFFFVDGKAVGALTTKATGEGPHADEWKAERSSEDLPAPLTAPRGTDMRPRWVLCTGAHPGDFRSVLGDHTFEVIRRHLTPHSAELRSMIGSAS